jgi:RHS repeat-associated protein
VNSLGQRDNVTTFGSAFGVTPNFIPADWAWRYNHRGELTKATSPTVTRDRAYQYDLIGNRKKSAHGAAGLPASDNYQVNALNQYSQVPNYTPQPAHDLDGNLTRGPVPGSNGNNPGVQPPADATNLQWDAENRLVSASVNNGSFTNVVLYQYDHLSRLIRRQINQNNPEQYHYDGWNRIGEYSADSLTRTYTWGIDLSGSLQGAGGVGGLLANRIGSANYYPFYDGNGNITQYMNDAGGTAAHFEYDPFGTLTRRTGLITFSYRFSTKPRDTVTGLYYYTYRWYDPVTGRWPSRDPIGERGGLNLYGFVGNSPVFKIDRLGNIEIVPGAPHIDKFWKRLNIGGGALVGALELAIEFYICCRGEVGDEGHVRTPASTLASIVGQPVLQLFSEQCDGPIIIVLYAKKYGEGFGFSNCTLEYRMICLGQRRMHPPV